MAPDDPAAATAAAMRGLLDWAAAVRVEAIPPPVLARAVRVLADDLAAIVGARDEPEIRRMHERTLARPRGEEATVFRGGRPRTDRLSAAAANGLAADWLELDEGYRKAPCHAGLYLVPALLAECEAHALRWRDMLRAIAVGYEIVTRVARAWKQPRDVMQSHGRYSAVGAAAAVALARNADSELLRAAVNGAVTLVTPAPRDHLVAGALSRNVWPAAGAWAGTMSVDWAECGIGGVDSAFHDVYTTVHGGTADPRVLGAGLGIDWAILDGYFKIHACCQNLHSAVEAALTLAAGLPPGTGPDDITAIAVAANPPALPLANARPVTTLGAKFSLPHAVAAALVTGSGGADAFSAVALADPRIARLRALVTITPYLPLPAPPDDRPARVVLRLADGRTFAGECLSAQGGADRPFPPSVVAAKIAALTAPVYPRFAAVFAQLMQSPLGPAPETTWPAWLDRLCAP